MAARGSPQEVARVLSLRAEGMGLNAIAAIVGRSEPTVAAWCNPDRRAAQREAHRRTKEAHRRTKEAHFASSDHDKKRAYLRRQAREEAAETGEDVQAIYARWGVA